MNDLAKRLKLLADPSRLQILASLNKEPMYVELLSERLELHPSTVSFHLKKLEEAGLVRKHKDQYYVVYELDRTKLDFNVLHEVAAIATRATSEEEREQAYYDKIKNTFFDRDGTLKSIPVQRKKRLVILEEIAKSFEIGKAYPEKQVNQIIAEYHFDFCTIRREFIMNRMFERDNGIYVRLK